MSETNRPLKVFLCHAHSDKKGVKALYERLVNDGVDAWLDKEKLLPGQDWELEIRRAVRESDVIVVCLSTQFNKAGFRQKEVRLALDTAMEKPEGDIFIIPARLEVCDSPESLKKWHWVDLFEDNGYDMLMRALRSRADNIGATLQAKRSWVPRSSSLRVKPEKTLQEDEAAAPPSDETSTKKANIDTEAKHLRIPSIAERKPFKLKTGYIVAIIGIVAMIIAAIIRSPLIERWFSQAVAPTTTVTSSGSSFQRGITIQHHVNVGESLFQIARCYGAGFVSLLNANPQISDPKDLSSVTVITVPNIGSAGVIYGPPCVTFYTVQSGDSWESIATKFYVDLDMLKETNEDGILTPGQKLVIPSDSTATIARKSSLKTPSAMHILDPNEDDCLLQNILPGQVYTITTTYFITNNKSPNKVTHVVHDPEEDVNTDTDDMILYGKFNSEFEGKNYRYCFFNRSASTITYTYTERFDYPAGPIRLNFLSETNSVVVSDTVFQQNIDRYVLTAVQGQTLDIKLTTPANKIALAVYNSNGTALKTQDLTQTWSGIIPSNGDYFIELVNVDTSEDNLYTLEVSITP